MELTIKDKNYEVIFDTRAVKKLDKKYKVKEQGLEFGMGASLAYTMLDQKALSDMSYILQVATKGNHSENIIDDAIDAYGEEYGSIKGLYEELKEELGKSPITADTIEEYKENLEREMSQRQN